MKLTLLISTFSLFTALTSVAKAADYTSHGALAAQYDESGKPICPRYYVVAKKYCWSDTAHWFNQCGYFCNKSAVPAKGPSGR